MEGKFPLLRDERITAHLDDVAHLDEFFEHVVVEPFGEVVAGDIDLQHTAFILDLQKARFSHQAEELDPSRHGVVAVLVPFLLFLKEVGIDVVVFVDRGVPIGVVRIRIDPHAAKRLGFFDPLLYVLIIEWQWISFVYLLDDFSWQALQMP